MDSVVEGRQDLFENYKLSTFIARGLNQVYEVVSLDDQTLKCAKLVHLNDAKDLECFKKEISFLEATRLNPHPNIINYDGYYIHEEKKDKFHAFKTGFIIMERAKTNLDYFLRKKIQLNQEFQTQEIIIFFKSMLAAHCHLQAMNIAHRDIKPENILLFDQEQLLFKICDVGVGTESRGENTKTRTLMGTVAYLSPELFQAFKDMKNKSNYNPYKSDVFSLGLVFLYFGTLHRFDSKERTDNSIEKTKEKLRSIRKQLKLKYPQINGLSTVLKLMLEYDDTLRVDFLELSQKIEINNYLDFKHSIMENHFSVTKGIQSQYQTFSSVKDIPSIDNTVPFVEFKLNNLQKSPLEVQDIIEEVKNKLKFSQIRGFSINLELNNLDQRHIKPVIEIIEKNPMLEEIKIYLWNNQILNQGLIDLIEPIAKTVDLKSLVLSVSANTLGDKGINQCIPYLAKLKSLVHFSLDLGMNRLGVECAESIFKILVNYQLLESLTLNLETNNLNLFISKLLQDNIKCLHHLVRLHINFSNNILQDQGLFEIGDILSRLQQCTLVLWNCGIKDKGITEFSKGFKNCQNLESFNFILWNNLITEKGCKDLAENLVNLKLKEFQINLSNNKCLDMGIRYILQALECIPSIEKLKLHFDNVQCTWVACRYIARVMSKNKQITTLQINLRGNQIDYQGAELLYMGFIESVQIQNLTLNLENSQIQDEGFRIIMKGLGKIKQLQTLFIDLQDSQIIDDAPLSIPDYIAGWKYLTEVSIDLRKFKLSCIIRNPISDLVISTVKEQMEVFKHKIKYDVKFTEKKTQKN